MVWARRGCLYTVIFRQRRSSIEYTKRAGLRTAGWGRAAEEKLAPADYVIGQDRPNLAPEPVFYPTPTPTRKMVSQDASSSHAGAVSESLKVCFDSEKVFSG